MKTLRRFLKRRSLAAMFVTAYASVDLRDAGIKISTTNEQYRYIQARFDRILEALEKNLIERGAGFAGGVYRDRNAHGCLVYDVPLGGARPKAAATQNGGAKPRASRRLPEAKLMLLFDLVQTFRLAALGVHSRSQGARMPPRNAQNSQWGLAAALVSATFPTAPRVKGKDAKNWLNRFLKKNQEIVGYCDWPAIRAWNELLRELDA